MSSIDDYASSLFSNVFGLIIEVTDDDKRRYDHLMFNRYVVQDSSWTTHVRNGKEGEGYKESEGRTKGRE